MKRILGVDYGLSKIGLALGIGSIVEPYKILPNIVNHKVEEEALTTIVKIIDQEHIEVVVFGIPERNGEEVGHSKLIRKFAEDLKSKISSDILISFVDEALTSKESLDIAIESGISQKRRKADHSIAAGLIIERWWDENQNN